MKLLLLLFAWSQQHVSVSQGWICSDNCMCSHTETEVADQTFYLTQSQYTDTRPNSQNADPVMPGAWQGSHWSTNVEVSGMTRPGKRSMAKAGIEPRSAAIMADTLPLNQTRQSLVKRTDPSHTAKSNSMLLHSLTEKENQGFKESLRMFILTES